MSEIVLGGIAMESLGPMIVSSVVANIVMREFAGYRPPYEMPVFPAVTGPEVLLFVVLGALCGVLAPQFLHLLDASKNQFKRLPVPLPVRLALGGLVVGVISVWVPDVWGNGYSVVNLILHSPWTGEALVAVLVFKVIATSATVGSGAIGGCSRRRCSSARCSARCSAAMQAVWPGHTSAYFAYAIVGMGAFLTGATQAPLMAILMIFEMTLSYQVVLPLLVSCVFAYFVARATGTTSMYEITLHHHQDAEERSRIRTTQMRELIQPAQTVVPLTASVADMTRVFLEYPVKYLYVTDDAGRFRGAVALKDITSDLLDKRDTADKTAAHYVHTPFPLLTPDMPLATALERFMAFQGERLPVIESEAEPTLAGVVYKTSLLDAYRRMTGER